MHLEHEMPSSIAVWLFYSQHFVVQKNLIEIYVGTRRICVRNKNKPTLVGCNYHTDYRLFDGVPPLLLFSLFFNDTNNLDDVHDDGLYSKVYFTAKHILHIGINIDYFGI